MRHIHIIPHMHWDREWYFTTEESRILLVNNMEEIMMMLETHDEYPYYLLDGQTAILEDYFVVKPENKERVKTLVKKGKLIIGPWYTQTDEWIVGAESIVRNLLYGIKDCKEFGNHMKIGYLPDSFGQTAQLPQILNGFDIKRAVYWRGTSERHGTDKTEFIWQSDEGSQVTAQILPLGYAIGKYLPVEAENLKDRVDKMFTTLDQGATSDQIIIPNGHDQMPIQQNIFEVIEKLNKIYPDRKIFLSKYENVFDELELNQDLPVIKGEFMDGKYSRVHRSIFSTRMDIKAANTRIENKITNILEPLATISYSLGFEYHHGFIELIWKEIMKNHAHDSIGCCCSDKVHQEIVNRFFIAEEKTDQLIRFYQRLIVDSIKTHCKEDRLTAFNLLPYDREEIMLTHIITKYKGFKMVDHKGQEIEFELIAKEEIDPGLIDRQIVAEQNYEPFLKYQIQFKDRIPAMGYKTYFVIESNNSLMTCSNNVETIETDFYQITINANGTLRIIDKQTNQIVDQVFLLEDTADDGDEYDYSPLLNDNPIYSEEVQAKVNVLKTNISAIITINYDFNIPSDLQNRKNKRINSVVHVSLKITVPNSSPILSIEIELDNQAKDHRLRLLVPTGIAAKCSISDNQFGYIKRPVYDMALDVWQEEKWVERPDTIYPMLNFVGISEEKYGVAVLTNSTREYQIIGENYNTIAITLFRSIGVLGKENLVRRPGRPSGIKLETPDSQLIGKLKIALAWVMHPKSTLKANIGRLAKEYTTPIYFYNKIPYHALKLNDKVIDAPISYSLLKEVDSDLVLSVLKKSEGSSRYILRYYNPTDSQKILKIKGEISSASVTNLNEDLLEEIEVENQQISQIVKSNQFKTLMLKLD